MDNPVAMPNQDTSSTRYIAEMICRACGHEPESQWMYMAYALPMRCPECEEYAMRPRLGLAAKIVDGERKGHSA